MSKVTLENVDTYTFDDLCVLLSEDPQILRERSNVYRDDLSEQEVLQMLAASKDGRVTIDDLSGHEKPDNLSTIFQMPVEYILEDLFAQGLLFSRETKLNHTELKHALSFLQP